MSPSPLHTVFDEITDLVNQIDAIIPDIPTTDFTMADVNNLLKF